MSYTQLAESVDNLGVQSAALTAQSLATQQASDAAKTAAQAAVITAQTSAVASEASAQASGNAAQVKVDVLRQELTTTGADIVALPIAGADGEASTVAGAIQYLTPWMFGVTDNGVTDYTEKLRKMHARANALGVPVKYWGLRKVKVQSDAQIIVNSDVDFAQCDFQVLNGIETTPDAVHRRLFIVTDPAITLRTITLNPAELFAGAYAFTVPDDLGQGFLRIQSNKVINGRVNGTTDLFYEQVFKINRLGVVDFALNDDLTANTITATFLKSPTRTLTIEGLAADETKYNNQSLLFINRNLVNCRDFNILPRTSDIGVNTVNALITWSGCCDVKLENCATSGQPAPGGNGSYVLLVGNVANLHLTNVGSQTGWGSMGGSNINGLFVDNCNLNRVDVHGGAHNIFVNGGSMRQYGVLYGWGGGTISVRGVEVADTTVVACRSDYGGNFHGDIIVEDITMNMTANAGNGTTTFDTATVVDLSRLGGSLAVRAPRSITVRDIKVRSRSNGLAIRPVYCKPTSAEVVTAPVNVVVDNVTANVKCAVTVSVQYSRMIAATGRKHTMNLSGFNAELAGDPVYTLYDPQSVSLQPAGTAAKPVVHIDHCQGVTGYFSVLSAQINISHSSLRAFKSYSGASPLQAIVLNDVDLVDTIAIGGEAAGAIGDINSDVMVNSARVRSVTSLANAIALQGVLVYPSVTCTLPGTATVATAFTGFKHASRFTA